MSAPMKWPIVLVALWTDCAAAAQFEKGRITLADFDRLAPYAALVRVTDAAGLRLAWDCQAATPVSAKGVSGRLPVVLDRLAGALGCTWSHSNGVVTVRSRVPVTLHAPAVGDGGVPLKLAGLPEPLPVQTVPTMPTLTLAHGDTLTYALRDYLRANNLNLVWGAGEAVVSVPGTYTGDTPTAVVDAVLKAHSLRGYYARSVQTVYVR